MPSHKRTSAWLVSPTLNAASSRNMQNIQLFSILELGAQYPDGEADLELSLYTTPLLRRSFTSGGRILYGIGQLFLTWIAAGGSGFHRPSSMPKMTSEKKDEGLGRGRRSLNLPKGAVLDWDTKFQKKQRELGKDSVINGVRIFFFLFFSFRFESTAFRCIDDGAPQINCFPEIVAIRTNFKF